MSTAQGRPAVESIRIVCREPSHEEVSIDVLTRVESSWVSRAGQLPADPNEPWEPSRATVRHLNAEDRPAVGGGSRDELLGAMLGWPAADAVRDVYRFACPECRLTVQAREENLLPILQTLAEHAADEVPLLPLRLLRILIEEQAHQSRRAR